MKSTLIRPGYKVTIDREVIQGTSRGHHVPDENWRHADSSGHVHAFSNGKLPTLHWVVTGSYWCDTCRDEHEEGEWRCIQCEEAVEADYHFTGLTMFMVPGLASYTVETDDGRTYMLDQDEINLLLNAREEEADEVLLKIVSTKEPVRWEVRT